MNKFGYNIAEHSTKHSFKTGNEARGLQAIVVNWRKHQLTVLCCPA
jgi:hypothetical protein